MSPYGYVKTQLTNADGEALLHHYLDASKWDYPAGMIEEGETHQQAAVRELFERTGYRITPDKLTYLGLNKDFHTYSGQLEQALREGSPQTEISIRNPNEYRTTFSHRARQRLLG